MKTTIKVSNVWRTAETFSPAPGFGPGYRVEGRIITIRPGENQLEALIREGLDNDTHVKIIDR